MYKDSQVLLKRARSKYLSYGLSVNLKQNNPDSPLNKSYFGSMLCSGIMRQEGQKLITTYCKQRWCAVCNRIRTAKAISGYLPVIRCLDDLYFVTLTKKTVKAIDLKESIDLMNKTWRQITNTVIRKKTLFQGVRKAECTIRPNNLYHYHFHIIISGKHNAEWLVKNWLKRMGDLADGKAQDCRKADEQSLKEIFKYFTKLTASDKQGERKLYDYSRMDVIFQAMRNRRVFQPFGGLRILSEDIEDINGQDFECLEEAEQVWKWHSEDWINDLGECLTGYKPSEKFKDLFTS